MNTIFQKTDPQLLAQAKLFDSFQFLENIEANLGTAEYAKMIIEQINQAFEEKQQEFHHDQNATTSKSGFIEYSAKSLYEKTTPTLTFFDQEIDPYFLLRKNVKDFIQYIRSAFDILFQFINKTMLVESALPLEKVTVSNLKKELKQKYPNHPVRNAFLNLVHHNDYKYITEYNNKTKHILDTKLTLVTDLLHPNFSGEVASFTKNQKPYDKKEIILLVNELYTFTTTKIDNLLKKIRQHIQNHLQRPVNRLHTLSFYSQDLSKDKKNSYFTVYVDEKDIPSPQDPVEVLFVKEDSNANIKAQNVPYDKIYIMKDDNFIGVLEATTPYNPKDDIYCYRKFQRTTFKQPKPTNTVRSYTTGALMLNYMSGKLIKN